MSKLYTDLRAMPIAHTKRNRKMAFASPEGAMDPLNLAWEYRILLGRCGDRCGKTTPVSGQGAFAERVAEGPGCIVFNLESATGYEKAVAEEMLARRSAPT